MRDRELVNRLLQRLVNACAAKQWSDDTWSRGVEVIQRKYNIQVWLSKFEPSGFIQTEQPIVTLSIVPTDEVP